MEIGNTKDLVVSISKGKGILSELAKDRLDSNTYTADFGKEVIQTVCLQSMDDVKEAYSCWGEDVVKQILSSKKNIGNYFLK
jgi:hypothetical protein